MFSLSPFRLLASGNAASMCIEHGLVKLMTSNGQNVTGHRVVRANPKYFREGHVNNAPRVAALIEEATVGLGGKVRQVTAVVPGFQNRLRIMEFPKAAGFDARMVIGQEAARTMRATQENYFLSWKRLPDHFDRSRWLVLAAHRRAIASIVDTANQAKIRITALELRPLALARAINQPEAIIAWTAPDGCDIVIVKNATPLEHQSIFWGADLVENRVLVERLIEVVGRTLTSFNENSVDGRFPGGAPLYVCGSPVNSLATPKGNNKDNGQALVSICQQVAKSLGPPWGELDVPMAADSDFSADGFVVNVGLNLRDV